MKEWPPNQSVERSQAVAADGQAGVVRRVAMGLRAWAIGLLGGAFALLARLFHHSCGMGFGAAVAADGLISKPNQTAQMRFPDSGTHSPLPPLFMRAGDSTLATYPVLNALATCAKMF